jgi:sugar/nucleoside kinase (ribokinase family)
MLDVCSVADLCADLLLAGDVVPRFGQVEQLIDDYALEVGGSATIFASQFARLGGRAGLIGAVGDDTLGRAIGERLATLGVEISRVARRPDLQTGLGVSLVKPDGDRAMLTYLGAIHAAQPADLTEDLLATCRHWHLASLFLLDPLRGHWRSWLERCRTARLTTSLDTNWDPEERWEGVAELLPLVDVFLPNEAEALAITGARDVHAAGEQLAGHGRLVVIKRGSEGALAFRGDRRWQIEAVGEGDPPPQIVDTVGAGDNFDAGFLRAWLLGREIPTCLSLATRCARASLAAAGGIAGQLQEAQCLAPSA